MVGLASGAASLPVILPMVGLASGAASFPAICPGLELVNVPAGDHAIESEKRLFARRFRTESYAERRKTHQNSIFFRHV